MGIGVSDFTKTPANGIKIPQGYTSGFYFGSYITGGTSNKIKVTNTSYQQIFSSGYYYFANAVYAYKG